MMTSSIQKLWPFRQLVLLKFSLFSIETYRKKEIVVILKRIDQLPQNLVRVHNLKQVIKSHKKGLLKQVIKSSNFSILSIVFIVFYCLSFVRLLFQLWYSIRSTRCSLMEKFDAKL